MERQTMTVLEVSDYLGVHPDTIYSMVQKEEIPHIRIRRRILFRLDTIEKWLSEKEQGSYR